MNALPEVPAIVTELAVRCRQAGGRALLVGGCVRDHLLGGAVKDWDVEVYGIDEPDLYALLRRIGRVDAVGRAFGVLKLHGGPSNIDVSLPRRDSKVGAGHRGIQVEGDPRLDYAEATRRRDLTVNALLMDPLTGELIDPHGGRDDIERRVLRAVDPTTFLEDPLRALRAVQFAARFEFDVDPGLVALCAQADLHELPPERVQGEWGKLLLQGRRPSLGLALARAAGVLARVFPEAAAADHPDVDVALDRLAAAGRDALEPEGRRWAVMLGAWLHRADTDAVSATLDRLRLHRWGGYPLRERVISAVSLWTAPRGDDAALRHLATKTEIELTAWLAWAVSGQPEPLDRLARARELGIAHEPPERLLLGRHLAALGVKPGPRMGALLAQVYELQLDGEVKDADAALDAARRLLSD